jgi:hypothetical protein
MITAYPQNVCADASALLVYQGLANVTVIWELEGSGTLVPGPGYTDSNGYAHAVYRPGAGNPIIRVTHGV